MIALGKSVVAAKLLANTLLGLSFESADTLFQFSHLGYVALALFLFAVVFLVLLVLLVVIFHIFHIVLRRRLLFLYDDVTLLIALCHKRFAVGFIYLERIKAVRLRQFEQLFKIAVALGELLNASGQFFECHVAVPFRDRRDSGMKRGAWHRQMVDALTDRFADGGQTLAVVVNLMGGSYSAGESLAHVEVGLNRFQKIAHHALALFLVAVGKHLSDQLAVLRFVIVLGLVALFPTVRQQPGKPERARTLLDMSFCGAGVLGTADS